MATTPIERSITCFNQQGNKKIISMIRNDGIIIQCRHCGDSHIIPMYFIMRKWEQQDHHRVTCSAISKHNKWGEAKLAAKIVSASGDDPDMVLVWCRYCRTAHRITKEQCEQVWTEVHGE